MAARITADLAAEFHVASQLARLGYTVTLTIGKHKEIDIIAVHPDGRVATIDAKGLKNKTNWPMKPKKQNKGHFFALVCYKNKFNDPLVPPETFVIPSTEIDKLLTPWSGNPKQTGVGYGKVKGSAYAEAWSSIFP